MPLIYYSDGVIKNKLLKKLKKKSFFNLSSPSDAGEKAHLPASQILRPVIASPGHSHFLKVPVHNIAAMGRAA